MKDKITAEQLKYDIAALNRIADAQRRTKELAKKKVGFFSKEDVQEYQELKKFERKFIN